jgi:hypothetical protein
MLSAQGATAASSQTVNRWFWSPGYCKSMLKQYGVQLGDGRTFNVEQIKCVGWGGSEWCEWSQDGYERQYSRFHVMVRSYDSVVRAFDIKTTGKTTWSGLGKPLILGTNVPPYKFAQAIGPFMNSLARLAHEKGCAPY